MVLPALDGEEHGTNETPSTREASSWVAKDYLNQLFISPIYRLCSTSAA